jgi:hypothetical protein
MTNAVGSANPLSRTRGDYSREVPTTSLSRAPKSLNRQGHLVISGSGTTNMQSLEIGRAGKHRERP